MAIRRLISLCVFLLVGWAVFGQELPPEKVPAAIRNAFKRSVPPAKPKWTRGDKGTYDAYFLSQKGNRFIYVYDVSGRLLLKKKEILPAQLPGGAQATIIDDFASPDIKRAYQVVSPKAKYYEVAVQTPTTNERLKFSGAGKMMGQQSTPREDVEATVSTPISPDPEPAVKTEVGTDSAPIETNPPVETPPTTIPVPKPDPVVTSLPKNDPPKTTPPKTDPSATSSTTTLNRGDEANTSYEDVDFDDIDDVDLDDLLDEDLDDLDDWDDEALDDDFDLDAFDEEDLLDDEDFEDDFDLDDF